MPRDFILFILFGCLRLNLLLRHVLLTRVFLSSGLAVILCRRIVGFRFVALLRSYHFPLHFEGALAQKFVLGAGQVDSDFSAVENVEIGVASADSSCVGRRARCVVVAAAGLIVVCPLLVFVCLAILASGVFGS